MPAEKGSGLLLKVYDGANRRFGIVAQRGGSGMTDNTDQTCFHSRDAGGGNTKAYHRKPFYRNDNDANVCTIVVQIIAALMSHGLIAWPFLPKWCNSQAASSLEDRLQIGFISR